MYASKTGGGVRENICDYDYDFAFPIFAMCLLFKYNDDFIFRNVCDFEAMILQKCNNNETYDFFWEKRGRAFDINRYFFQISVESLFLFALLFVNVSKICTCTIL